MTLYKIVSILSISVALFSGPGVAPFSQPPLRFEESKGVVKGKVIGAAGEIPDIKVFVESVTAKREVITDKSGNYEIELPTGVYTITATVPEYYPYRRAPFRVRPGTVTIINLDLALIGADRAYGGGTDIHYEKLSLPYTSDEQLDLLVVYEDRKEDDKFIKYNGVELYYDALAVYAVNMQLDKRSFRFKANGNVHVENNQQSRAYVRQADISFAGSTPVIELTFGAIDYISGKGSIEGDKVNFEFRIEKDRTGQFTYEDKKTGISFNTELYSFRVVDDEANKVEFIGAAKIAFSGSDEEMELLNYYTPPVGFSVTVQDNASTGADRFAISINLDRVIKRSGKLSKGYIEIHRKY